MSCFAGPFHGEGGWCREVLGVLGADPERAEDGVRRGHSGGSVPGPAAAQKTQVLLVLITRRFCRNKTQFLFFFRGIVLKTFFFSFTRSVK